MSLVYREGPDGPSTEIVGVGRDHKVRSLGEEPRPYIHFPRSQNPSRSIEIIARTSGPAELVLPSIRSEILAMEPEIVFTGEGTAAEGVELTLVPTRLGARLLGAFGGRALLLAAVGLYGVVAYAVARRTHEVGLRMALGADAPKVLKMILRQGMVLAIVGVGVGAVLAALLARVLQSLLYGVSSVDPVSLRRGCARAPERRPRRESDPGLAGLARQPHGRSALRVGKKAVRTPESHSAAKPQPNPLARSSASNPVLRGLPFCHRGTEAQSLEGLSHFAVT